MTPMTDGDAAGPVRAWWSVIVFALIAMISILDRGVLNLVVDPVRRDLGISDIQIGLLQGVAFGLFYATVGLPLGLCADRLSRHRLIVAGLSVWSLATFLGGLTESFAGLFVCRILVGLGEAALAPAAVSMISDLFPPDRRGRPISVFVLGQGLATGLSLQVTGYILAAVPRGDFAWIGWLDGLAPWRVAFLFCGLVGVLGLALLATIGEPARSGPRGPLPRDLGLGAATAHLWRHRAIFGPLYLGFAIVSIASYGSFGWLPTMLKRQFGMSPREVGDALGLVAMVAGAIGALGAGQIIDLVTRRGPEGAKFLFLAVTCALALPGAFGFLAPDGSSAILIAGILIGSFPVFGTGVIATTQDLMPVSMRGVAVALMGFTNSVIGLTCGPLLIAMATQDLYRDESLVGAAIATVSAPVLILAGIVFLAGHRALRRHRAEGRDPALTLDRARSP